MTEGQDRGFYFPKTAYDLVAIASSAGGLRALISLFEQLPNDFPAAIAVVQHLDPRHISSMAGILTRKTSLVVKQADNDEIIKAGTIYVAPPDRHLLVNPDQTLSLSHTELVHFVRPSGDLLFESVAASLHRRAIAVVLTGTGVDGATGVQAIRKMGGVVIAQNEQTSEFYGMPKAAIETGCVDYVLPLEEIAVTLNQLIKNGVIE